MVSATVTVAPAAALDGPVNAATFRSGPMRTVVTYVLFVSLPSATTPPTSALAMTKYVPAVVPDGICTGVDAVHVWAFTEQGQPLFVGVAEYGVARPDVAAAFGKAGFTNSGFSLPLTGLAPGRYTLAVCARRTGMSEFDLIRVVTVEVEPGGARD